MGHMKYGVTGREREEKAADAVDGLPVHLLTERLMMIAIIIL